MAEQKARKQKFVDPKVQGALVWRVFLYWLAIQGIFISALICWEAFAGGARPIYQQLDVLWYRYSPALILSLLILPIILTDLVRMTNRFAGPMVRFRRAMRDLSYSRPVFPLSFRDNDYWSDVATDFNRLLDRVQAYEQARALWNQEKRPEEEPAESELAGSGPKSS